MCYSTNLSSVSMLTFDEFRQLCVQRRSVRYFEQRPIDKETLQKLLDTAHIAPSVENTQPWHFHIIVNPQLKSQLMQTACYGNFIVGASVFIVVSCNKSSKPKTQEVIWNPKEMEYSCVSAMDHLMLAATTMGIGSCWVSLHHGPVHDILKLKDNHVVVGGLMLGHLKTGEELAHSEHVRRPLSECTTVYE